MRRLGLLACVVVVAAGAAGGAAYFIRGRDPLAAARALQAKGDQRAAALELRTAVRAHPENAEAHWRLGTALLALGDPIAAEKELETAGARGTEPRALVLPLAQAYLDQHRSADLLRDFPVSRASGDQIPLLLVDRATAQLDLKDVAAAQASIAEAERLAPHSAEVAFAAARAASFRKDYAAAATELDRSLAINPRNAPAQLMKAELLNLKGDRPAAIAALDQAIAVQPKLTLARVARANLLMQVGQDAKSRADVDAMLADNPKDPLAIYLEAVLLVRAQDFAAADVALEKISTVLTRIPRGEFFLAVVKFNLGQREQALDAATHFVARNPTDLAGVKLLAQIDLSMQRPDRAAEVLSRAASAGKSDAEALDMLGRAYAAIGAESQAVQSFERASTLAPKNPDILTRLASARYDVGDKSGAADDFARSLELGPVRIEAGVQAVMSAIAAGDLDLAQSSLAQMRARKADPNVIDVLDARIKLAQLDYAGAQAELEAVLKNDPKSLPAHLALAEVDQITGRADDAVRELRAALALQPTNETANARLITLLVATNHANEALDVAAAALKSSPGNVTLATLYSDLCIRAGDPKRGLAALDSLPKDRAALVPAQAARARVQVALGNGPEAQKIYTQVLATDPGNLEVRIALLNLLLTANDLAGARDVVRDGLAATPGNPALLNAAVTLAARADGTDGALKEADALARDPGNAPASRALRGNVYMAAKQYDDAAAAYAAALKAEPSTPLAIDLSTALVAGGKTDAALRGLGDWVAAHPEDVIALSALSGLEMNAKRGDDAVPHLQAVLARRPNDVIALNNLAWIYQGKGDPRALALGQKAYLLAPTPQTADTLGWILTQQGKAGEAVPLLQEALAGAPTDPAVAYHLATALKDVGQKDQAIALLKALAADPAAFDDKAAAQKALTELTAP
jgi:putative PEP-CTERM system TPR-repeat lipoprotein